VALTSHSLSPQPDHSLTWTASLLPQNICFLQHENGLDIGDRLHGRQSASTALETIYTVQREQMTAFLTTPNVYTKRRPYIGEAADKVSDKQFASWEPVNGRVNYLGTPVSFIMEMRAMTSESADADACLAEIDGANDGLHVLPYQRLSYCFDGEACYQGEVSRTPNRVARLTTSHASPRRASHLVCCTGHRCQGAAAEA
jgi:hypothetical protein